MTSSAGKYKEISQYPILQTYKPVLAHWLDTYIRRRCFGRDFDPLDGENWRVLLLEDVTHEIAGVFGTKLVELQATQSVAEAVIQYRLLSETNTIPVRTSTGVDVSKCIYPKLPVPSKGGGLERLFIEWADQDSHVKALLKVHEYRHDFLRRPYLKTDGMPAQYSPDFLIRTDADVYVVETKAQSALSDENVKRKQRAALAWCEQLNQLPSHQRLDLSWHYVLLGESMAHDWHGKNARASELLDYARLRRTDTLAQGTLL